MRAATSPLADLTEDDILAVMRILGDLAGDTVSTHEQRRCRLLTDVSALIGADRWMWVLIRLCPDGKPATYMALDGGWASPEELGNLYAADSDPEYLSLATPRVVPLLGRHVTLSRQDLAGDEEWCRTGFYQRFLKPIGLGHFLWSSYPVGEGHLSSVGVYRKDPRPAFSKRERGILHLVMGEIDWLHRQGTNHPAQEAALQLTPRQRSVMLLLLRGDSVKQIASRLRLSRHTVNDHLKEIHRRFGVQSRAELLARFMAGAQPLEGGV